MHKGELKIRKARAAGLWYPQVGSENRFPDNPSASCVISPHAGFRYSGQTSLEAVSYVKKNRIWVFGTSHREAIDNGISVYYGSYSSSIGKTKFPVISDAEKFKVLEKYFSDRGHRTEEHSVENVLYCLNHFQPEITAICTYVQAEDGETFEKVSDDVAKLWEKGDSIVVSTDWNHYVSTNIIEGLMEEAAGLLREGDIGELYKRCMQGKLEACGIDGVYLAYKVLSKVSENTKFKVLSVTDSSQAEKGRGGNIFSKSCVGYIAARN